MSVRRLLPPVMVIALVLGMGCMANPTPYPQTDAAAYEPSSADGSDKQGDTGEGGGSPGTVDGADATSGDGWSWNGDVAPPYACPDIGGRACHELDLDGCPEVDSDAYEDAQEDAEIGPPVDDAYAPEGGPS